MNKEIMAVPSHWRPFAGGGAGPGQACGLDLDQGAGPQNTAGLSWD